MLENIQYKALSVAVSHGYKESPVIVQFLPDIGLFVGNKNVFPFENRVTPQSVAHDTMTMKDEIIEIDDLSCPNNYTHIATAARKMNTSLVYYIGYKPFFLELGDRVKGGPRLYGVGFFTTKAALER